MTTIDLDRIEALVTGRILPDTEMEGALAFELRRIRELRDVEALIAERDQLYDDVNRLRRVVGELRLALRRGEQPPLAAILSRLEEALSSQSEVDAG